MPIEMGIKEEFFIEANIKDTLFNLKRERILKAVTFYEYYG